jgi:periplasmic protein CpxP/Spy
MNQRNPLKAFAFLAVPAALLIISGPVLAQPFQGEGDGPQQRGAHAMGKGHPGGPGQRQGGGRSEMMEQLGLSAEQKQKVKALMEQGKSQSQALNQQLKTKRQAMMQYLQSPNASEATARSMNAEISDIQKNLSELRLKTWFGMRSILTPEQLQKLNQMKGKRPGSHMGQGNEGGGGQGPGRMHQQGQMGPRRGGMAPGQFGPDGDDGSHHGPRPDSGYMPSSGTRIGYLPQEPGFQPEFSRQHHQPGLEPPPAFDEEMGFHP